MSTAASRRRSSLDHARVSHTSALCCSRHHPDDSYQGFELLSMWSSYLVQLPYYMVHTFNSDPVYQRLFKSHCELSLPIDR